MDSKLKEAKTGKKVTLTTNTQISVGSKQNEPPKGAKIRTSEERTSTEEIENGFLITKNVSGTYYTGKGDSDYSWFDYSRKWYSKTDPLTITVNDKSIADAFDED